MGRTAFYLVFCGAALSGEAQNGTAGVRPAPEAGRVTIEERFRIYLDSAVGPTAVAGKAAAAGIQLWRDSPPEWGQGMAGYGRHFGYRYARHTLGESMRFGAGILLKEDPRRFPSPDRSAWGRVRYALLRTVVSRKESGGAMPAYSRFIGAYGSAWIANAWYPPTRRDASDVLLRGTYSIGASAGSNIFREFWPDLKRKIFRRR